MAAKIQSHTQGIVRGTVFLLTLVMALGSLPAMAAGSASQNNGTQVLEAFDRQQVERVKNASELSDHEKQVIQFALGVPLIILLLVTGGLGIATGVYGKQLFLAHMVCAGLTLTLALVHIIVAVVWFYPF